jgi:hypothetical protein
LGGHKWRGQALIIVEVEARACPLRQLQETHQRFRIYRPRSVPRFSLLAPQSDCPDRVPDWATFSPAFCGSSSSIFCGMGDAFFVPAAKALSRAYEEGIAGMPTIIKASLLASALMLLESCTGYLTSYQTPCVEGHVCQCVQYTTVHRSWLDCRDYGRVKSRAY